VNARLLFPLLSATLLAGCSRTARQEKQALEQVHQLAALTMMFVTHEARFPNDFEELLSATGADRAILVSPVQSDRSVPSYELLLPGKRLQEIREPARTVLIRSNYTIKHGARLFLFADGRVELFADSDLHE
jgi:hypothetical protein